MAVTQSLTLTEKSYSIANNTSQVRLLWTSTQTGQSHNDYTKTASYTMNGTTYTVSYTLPANTTKTIVDKTFTIKHNSDGTKTVSASTKMDTGISAGTIQKSASLTLTAIPRASTISATDANIGSNTTITIAKSDADYTSTLYYSLDGGTTKVLLGTVRTPSTKITWTIPDEFYAKIPNAKSGKIYFYCNTYNGTTQVGSQTSCSITASAVESVCKPTISATIQNTNIQVTDATGDANVIIPKISIAAWTVSASANKSATLTSYSIKCGTAKVSNTASGVFNPAQSNKFTLTATDSRGFTTTVDIEKPTVAWTAPTGTITGTAPNPSTNEATITVNGKWFNGNFGQEDNAINVVLYAIPDGGTAITLPAPEITINGDEWTATLDATDLDYRTAWTYEARVSDQLSYAIWYNSKVSSIPTFDWGAESFNFNVPVSAPSLTLNSPWETITFSRSTTNTSSGSATIKYCPMLGIAVLRVYVTSNKIYNSGNYYTVGSISEHLPPTIHALACYNTAGNADARITTDGSIQVFAHSSCASGYDFAITGIFWAGGD